jgi:hypothetical protein
VTHVVIGTPAFGGQVTVKYMLSVMRAVDALLHHGVEVSLEVLANSLVQRARSNIAANFLTNPTTTHLIFIDADIEFGPSDLIRLLDHDRDVIAGIYPRRGLPIDFAFRALPDADGYARRCPVSGAIEVEMVATGFMCIKRHVFERMAQAWPAEKFRGEPGELTPEQERHLFNYFPVTVEDGLLLSEDYGFCRRWRALGGEIWIDPAIRLGHIGTTTYAADPVTLFKPLSSA